jgi:hypothetical protein
MFDEKWNEYAKTWSRPGNERDAILANLVSDDVVYTDPNTQVFGRSGFSAHMAQFQDNVPGGYFEIIDVKGHHNQTLARWRLCGKDGNEMMQGTSHASLSEGGMFTSFSGFF